MVSIRKRGVGCDSLQPSHQGSNDHDGGNALEADPLAHVSNALLQPPSGLQTALDKLPGVLKVLALVLAHVYLRRSVDSRDGCSSRVPVKVGRSVASLVNNLVTESSQLAERLGHVLRLDHKGQGVVEVLNDGDVALETLHNEFVAGIVKSLVLGSEIRGRGGGRRVGRSSLRGDGQLLSFSSKMVHN